MTCPIVEPVEMQMLEFENSDAWGQMLEGCRQYLLLIASEELGDDLQAKAGASDLVQETFLEAQKDLAQFRGQSSEELLAWLRKILLHRLAKFYRRYRTTQKRKLTREWEPPAGSYSLLEQMYDSQATTPSGIAVRGERMELLRDAIDRLPPDFRTVVLLRYRDQLRFQQIAVRLDRSADAVRMLWYRAIDRLALELEGEQ